MNLRLDHPLFAAQRTRRLDRLLGRVVAILPVGTGMP